MIRPAQLLLACCAFSLAQRGFSASPTELPDDVVLSWNGTELTAGNGEILRQWKLVNGLPTALSLGVAGCDWLDAENQPTTSLPPGWVMAPPFRTQWQAALGRANPVEAPSHRGELVVMGTNGIGYRWEIKVFPHCPAVLCQLEMIGPAQAAADAPAADMLERLSLRPFENQLTAVDFVDATDRHDNLASERTWRLSAKERTAAATNLLSIDNPATGDGLAILKLEALPSSRPVPSAADVVGQDRVVTVYGHGAGPEGHGCEWAMVGFSGGKWGRAIALHRLQSRLREFQPGRDGMMLSNTWGDRSQDSRVSESFVAEEIKAGAELGVDVCQIDDGWQRGITKKSASAAAGHALWQGGFWKSDPHFWEPRPNHFPSGLESTAAAAKSRGMGLGLWFSPDGANDYENWMKDADAVLGFHRRWGVNYVKVDGTHVVTKTAEWNLRRFIDRVLTETKGEVSFDFDITADIRMGYFGLVEAGPLFLENRYTDSHGWWPHATLRNLWQLSWYVPPQRLRIEFLNATRNHGLYSGDPLAPGNYPADYPFAVTMVANPLAWFEVSHLPPSVAAPIRALVAVWKTQRDELHQGTIIPIGDCPSGFAWTGFCSINSTGRQVLVFRERTDSDSVDLPLPATRGAWRVSTLAGTGMATWNEDRLHVRIPQPLNYLWVRLSDR